jgi:recombination protein RecA
MAKSKKTTTVEVESKSQRDDLVDELANLLNKSNKEYDKVAYNLVDEDDPSNVADWISTGCSVLDVVISNKQNGGVPAGRITELSGQEGSGKSLVCSHILANTQKKGGVAVLIDTESACSTEFMKAVGVDVGKLLYINVDTVEDIFENIMNIVTKVRQSSKDRLVTIVVDSLAGASTKTEMEADFTKDGYATAKSIILSKGLRKITNMISRQKIALVFTNQVRYNMNAMAFAEKFTVSGGKALPHHSSVRVRMTAMTKIKKKINNIDEVIGVKTQATVTKNRFGPPHRKAEFDILFDRGIDEYGCWLNVLKTAGEIKQAGAYYKYTKKDKEDIQFQTKDFVEMINNDPDFKEELYNLLCQVLIRKYRDQSAEIEEDIEYSDDEDAGSVEE